MKHGPIALVDQDMPIVFLATHHQLYEKIISNMQEVKSRNGRILAVVTEGDQQVKEIADNVLEVPRTLNALVPLQLLAYYVAVDKGTGCGYAEKSGEECDGGIRFLRLELASLAFGVGFISNWFEA